MTKFLKLSTFIILMLFTYKCGIYSFTGASIPEGTKTFQVNYFENLAGNRPGSTIEPGLDQEFTIALQDLILNQTNLNLVTSNALWIIWVILEDKHCIKLVAQNHNYAN